MKAEKIKKSQCQKLYVRWPGNLKHSFFNTLSANWPLLKLCSSIKPNVWYLQSLEKLAIKCAFRSIFLKKSKDRHFVAGGSKNLKLSTNTCIGVSFQKNIFSSFLLFLSVCYQDDLNNSERNEIASSTARNFNNIWLICQIFRNNKPLAKYLTDEKFKKWAVFIFEIKGAKKDKIFSK